MFTTAGWTNDGEEQTGRAGSGPAPRFKLFQTAFPEMSLCWKQRHPPRTAPSVKLGQLTLTLTSPRIAAEHNGGSHRTTTSRTR